MNIQETVKKEIITINGKVEPVNNCCLVEHSHERQKFRKILTSPRALTITQDSSMYEECLSPLLKFYLFERQKEKEGCLPLAGSVLKCPQQPGLDHGKARVQNPIQVLHEGGRKPSTWALLLLPVQHQGNGYL